MEILGKGQFLKAEQPFKKQKAKSKKTKTTLLDCSQSLEILNLVSLVIKIEGLQIAKKVRKKQFAKKQFAKSRLKKQITNNLSQKTCHKRSAFGSSTRLKRVETLKQPGILNMRSILLPVAMVHSKNQRLYPGAGMLVVIDPSVADYEVLASGVLAGAQVLVLKKEEDAIAQITAALHCAPTPFATLHIVTGGSPGVVHFTSGDFSLKTLGSYVEQLQTWFANQSSSFNVLNPKIFFYGSRIGAQSVGLELVDTLTWLTSATIAAATTSIGSRQWAIPGQSLEECAFTPATRAIYKGVLKGILKGTY
jgi:hypothetical protein